MKIKILLIGLLFNIAVGYSQTFDAFEPNQSLATGTFINSCTNYTASIGLAGDLDYYSVNGTNGQEIHINIFYIPINLTLKVTVYDSSTTQVASWTGSGSISQTYTPSSSSTIYLKVEEISNNFSEEPYLYYLANATCVDTDGDGLLDITETNGTTDSLDSDTDDDTINDALEIYVYTTNPTDGDTDDDGLSDGNEVLVHDTNPLNHDSDTDGVFDGTELGVINPLPATNVSAGVFIPDADLGVTLTDPLNNDTDGDGLLDGQEDVNKNGSTDNPIIGGTGTVGSGETDPNDADSDSDALLDSDEVLVFGTNPLDTDTDDGGVDDNVEINLGSNPNDGNDDDVDGDGYTLANGDCDDNNPNMFPGGIEVLDGLDNNCNGSIDEGFTYVPDDNFENYLETHDTNGTVVSIGAANSMGNGIANDDFVTTSNINTVTFLDVTNQSIADLTGIEDFAALTILDCSDNLLTNLNVTQNTLITALAFSNNQITQIDVTQNPNLVDFWCNDNALTTLDVSQNSLLEDLYCFNNTISSISLAAPNTSLVQLFCFNNLLTTLDVSQISNLSTLNCNDNNINSLDVMPNPVLNRLFCSNNALTSLNVKNGNNTNFLQFDATGNPNLVCIRVDDAAWSNANWPNKDASATYINSQAECATLSNEEFVLVDFTLFPNPSTNNLTISIKEKASYTLVSVNGQLIKKGNLETGENTINVSNISNGLYFIQVKTAQGISTKKIIKN